MIWALHTQYKYYNNYYYRVFIKGRLCAEGFLADCLNRYARRAGGSFLALPGLQLRADVCVYSLPFEYRTID